MTETHEDLGDMEKTSTYSGGSDTILTSGKVGNTSVARLESCTFGSTFTTDENNKCSASSKLANDNINPTKEPLTAVTLSDPCGAVSNTCSIVESELPEGKKGKKTTSENCIKHITSKLRDLDIIADPLYSEQKITTPESAKNEMGDSNKQISNEPNSSVLRPTGVTQVNLVDTQETLSSMKPTKPETDNDISIQEPNSELIRRSFETIKTTETLDNTNGKIVTDKRSAHTRTNTAPPFLKVQPESHNNISNLLQNSADEVVSKVIPKDEEPASKTPLLPCATNKTFIADVNANPQDDGKGSLNTVLPLEENSSLKTSNATDSDCENHTGFGDSHANEKELSNSVSYITPTPPDYSTGGTIKSETNNSTTVTCINNTATGVYTHVNDPYRRQYRCLPLMTLEQVPRHSWTPEIGRPPRSWKKPYNVLRRRKYIKASVDQEKLDKLLKFYESKVEIDSDSEEIALNLVDNILEKILYNTNLVMSNQFHNAACDEGSVIADTKVGKLDESDHSVEILLIYRDEIVLSDEPFDIEYSGDDIDANVMDEIPATAFVCDRKRLFPLESRPSEAEPDPVDIPVGHVAVRLGTSDAGRFPECCISRDEGEGDDYGWILPYQLLRIFHRGIGESLKISDLDGVTLNNGARGPAVTLTAQQHNGPNISVDITPKLSLTKEILNITHFQWPRKDTKKWLTKSKIKSVTEEPIYLVPKGDKYWKISFANFESELLGDIDDAGTWRKECLKIMKKKLIQWKSKSRAGLKGLSSYLLKTTLLWLCEILPADKYWTKDQVANRYLNFLQELERRLKQKRLGEYFNPSVNLLEHKNNDEIEELREFLLHEIEELTGLPQAVSAQ